MSTAILKHHRNIYDLIKFTPVALHQRMFHFYLNLEACELNWSGTVMARWNLMQSPQSMRDLRSKIPYVPNGGFHFSYVGGAKRVMEKLNNTADGYECKSAEEAEAVIKECLSTGKGSLNHSDGKYCLIKPEKLGLEQGILDYIKGNYGYLLYDL